MLDFTWKVFSQTGSIDTYLLFKELESSDDDGILDYNEELAELDHPIS